NVIALLRQVVAEEIRNVLLVLHDEHARPRTGCCGQDRLRAAAPRDHPGLYLPRGSCSHGERVVRGGYWTMTAAEILRDAADAPWRLGGEHAPGALRDV